MEIFFYRPSTLDNSDDAQLTFAGLDSVSTLTDLRARSTLPSSKAGLKRTQPVQPVDGYFKIDCVPLRPKRSDSKLAAFPQRPVRPHRNRSRKRGC